MNNIIIALIEKIPWLIGFLALWWFRIPLTSLIDRVRTVKVAVGDYASGSLETSHAAEPSSATTSAPPAPADLEGLPGASTKPEALGDKSMDADVSHLFDETFQALNDGQVDKARMAFAKLQAAEKKEGERFFNEVLFRHRIFRLTGERPELDRLEELAHQATNKDQRRTATIFLFRTYTESGKKISGRFLKNIAIRSGTDLAN